MSDLNDLMEEDPLGLSDQKLDQIIAFQRQNRTGKVDAKAVPKLEKPLDLESLFPNLKKPKVDPGIRRI